MADRFEGSARPALVALDGEGGGFDPERVPAYPLVRAQIRQTDPGELEGLVDDTVVATDVELEPVRNAVINAAAEVAAKRVGPVKAIRVRGIGLDDAVFHLVVTAAGEVYETGEPGTSVTTGNGRQTKTAAGAGGSGKGSKTKERRSPLYIGVLALLICVPLIIIGTPLVMLIAKNLQDDPKPVPPAPKPVQLPVVEPAPYSPVARWSVNLGTATFDAQSAPVTADADRVYVARDSGANVAAYDAQTGRPDWEYTDLKGSVTAGPALTTVDGKERLAVASSEDLVLLDPATGNEVGEWDLAQGSQVWMTPTGPVALTDPGHARIVTDGDLVTRVIPATGTPVAPTADGALIVVGAAGEVWTVRDERVAQAPHTQTAPEGTSFYGVGGWTGQQLVLAYHHNSTSGSNLVRLAGYSPTPTSSGTDHWHGDWVSGQIPAVSATGEDLPLYPSPAGDWAMYGSSTVDLATGAVVPLPEDWATSAIGDARAFGTGAGRPLTAAPDGVLDASMKAPTPPTTSGLVAPQATAGTAAYLVTGAASGARAILYALDLPQDADSAPASASPVAPASSTSVSPSTKPTPEKSGGAR